MVSLSLVERFIPGTFTEEEASLVHSPFSLSGQDLGRTRFKLSQLFKASYPDLEICTDY